MRIIIMIALNIYAQVNTSLYWLPMVHEHHGYNRQVAVYYSRGTSEGHFVSLDPMLFPEQTYDV